MVPVGTASASARQQACVVGDVRPVLRSLVSQVRDLVESVDPDAVVAGQAVEVWDLCGELARLCTGVQTLVARRVAAAGVYKAAGARDTAEFLALRSGVSKSAMAQMLATSHRLAHQPVAADAVRRGELSAEQAHAVTDAAGTDLSEQRRLVGYARGRSLKELRDEALRAKAVADPAPEQTRRRQIEERHFRQGTGADGRWWFKGEGPPEDRARFEAALNPFIETAFRDARRQGRRESRDVLAYDALQALARHAHQGQRATIGEPGHGRDTSSNAKGRRPGHPHPSESSGSASPSQQADTESSRPQDVTGRRSGPGSGDPGGGREPGSQEDAAAGRWRSRETADLNGSRDRDPGGGGEPGSQGGDAAGHPGSQGVTGGKNRSRRRRPADGSRWNGVSGSEPQHDQDQDVAPAGGPASQGTTGRDGDPDSDRPCDGHGYPDGGEPGPCRDAAGDEPPWETGGRNDDPCDDDRDRGGSTNDGEAGPQGGDTGDPRRQERGDGNDGPVRRAGPGRGGSPQGQTERPARTGTAKPPGKVRRRENLSLLPVLRVDLAALQRGYLLAGELCEVSSNGPLTVGAARELVGDSVVKLVLTRHGDVATVAHLGRSSPTPTQLAILHADVTALTPGAVAGDGTCRIPGVGVVERSVAQRLLGQLDGTDVLDRVLARGRDVANLVHAGRQPTVAQRTALLWAQPACSVQGCAHTFTQIDHRREWRKQNLTELANLDRLCAHHHRLKSHQNYQLVPGVGDRAFVSPEDPRHPDNQSLATPRDRAPPQAA